MQVSRVARFRRFADERNGISIPQWAAFRGAHKRIMSVGSDYYRKLTALHPVTKRF